jgi:predicted CoA-binding protein
LVSRASLEAFLALRTLALAGASRRGGKVGNHLLKELLARGLRVYPVHPQADRVDGVPCLPSLADLPAGVEGLVLVVPPPETERLVRQAHEKGIRRVWMQQGAESEEALRFCRENGMEAIHGHCLLMFLEPVGFPHGLHRWIKGALGGLPS